MSGMPNECEYTTTTQRRCYRKPIVGLAGQWFCLEHFQEEVQRWRYQTSKLAAWMATDKDDE